MHPLNTPRLTLAEFGPTDAAFVLELINEPAFHQFIGDRGVRTPADARRYIEERLSSGYTAHGFGLWRVALAATGTPIGMCGLLKREILEDVDIGFAFLKTFEGQGYAFEAATAVVELARERFGLARLAAIVDPANARSVRLLGRLGFAFERQLTWPADGTRVDVYSRAI